MTLLQIRCDDRILSYTNRTIITSGDVNEDKILFDFSSEWEGYAKTAVFYRNEADVYHVLLDDENTCVIPHEVLAEPGALYFGVFGDLDGRTRTSEVILYTVRQGAITDATKVPDPSPDVYAQLMDRLDHVLDNGLPHKLTFTGASTGEYDGTVDVTINIPEGGEGGGGSTDISLGISGATTGCMTVIKTVDRNGKPTSYNALSIIDYANDIIGDSITLELQSANVGQIARIKAVDSKGIPTEWETVDMPNASIPVVSKTSSDTDVELSPNTFYVFPEMTSLSVTFSDPVSSDIVNEYKFRFTSGATATTLTLPSTVVGDITIEANKVYEISIVDNYLVYQSWVVS